MAKIKELPGLEIINGLKGKLDYYYWKGIPCCRSWPRSPGHIRSPAVMKQWAPFTYSVKSWTDLDITVKQYYNSMAVSTNFTGRDLFMRAYIKGLFHHLPL